MYKIQLFQARYKYSAVRMECIIIIFLLLVRIPRKIFNFNVFTLEAEEHIQ